MLQLHANNLHVPQRSNTGRFSDDSDQLGKTK